MQIRNYNLKFWIRGWEDGHQEQLVDGSRRLVVISLAMLGLPGGDKVQLQSDGRVPGKLWQWGPSPESFLGSPEMIGDTAVEGTGAVGAQWIKGRTPCWRKTMTPMLVLMPMGLWLKETVAGELRGGLQIGVVWIQVRFKVGHSVRCQGCFCLNTRCPICVWSILFMGNSGDEAAR